MNNIVDYISKRAGHLSISGESVKSFMDKFLSLMKENHENPLKPFRKTRMPHTHTVYQKDIKSGSVTMEVYIFDGDRKSMNVVFRDDTGVAGSSDVPLKDMSYESIIDTFNEVLRSEINLGIFSKTFYSLF
jgi:hypothetical protein